MLCTRSISFSGVVQDPVLRTSRCTRCPALLLVTTMLKYCWSSWGCRALEQVLRVYLQSFPPQVLLKDAVRFQIIGNPDLVQEWTEKLHQYIIGDSNFKLYYPFQATCNAKHPLLVPEDICPEGEG